MCKNETFKKKLDQKIMKHLPVYGKLSEKMNWHPSRDL